MRVAISSQSCQKRKLCTSTLQGIIIIIIFNYALQPSSLIVRSGLDVPTFATRHLHTSPRESTQWWKMELWARNVRKFCLNANFHVTFRDLLHVVKLRHGTDGFTSPLKEGVLRIFRPKNPTALAGCKPTNLGTKGQHTTSRPPKPLTLQGIWMTTEWDGLLVNYSRFPGKWDHRRMRDLHHSAPNEQNHKVQTPEWGGFAIFVQTNTELWNFWLVWF